MSDFKKQLQKHEKPKTVHVCDALSHTRVSKWFKRFRKGYEDCEDDSRSRQPSTAGNLVTVVKVHEVVARH